MKLPRVSRRARRWIRRGLAATSWLAVLGVTLLGFLQLVAWDEARTRSDLRVADSGREAVSTPPPEPVRAAPDPAPESLPAETAAKALPAEVREAEARAAEATEAAVAALDAVPAESSTDMAPLGPEPQPGDLAPPGEEGPALAGLPAAEPSLADPAPLAKPGDPAFAQGPGESDPPGPIVSPSLAALPIEPPPLLPFEEAVVPSVTPSVPPPPLEPTVPPGQRRRLDPQPLTAPSIAIVIDDMGYNAGVIPRLVSAGQPMTMAFLPLGQQIDSQARAAAAAGLEVLLHMPMEPVGRENPGPNAIRVGMSPAEIQTLMGAALATVTGAVGMNNHMGSKATADLASMQAVMSRLAAQNLFFLDSRTTGRSQALAAALAEGVPSIGRDVFLDNDPSIAAVTRQLDALERLARARGYAVAIGHPHASTIEALQRWIPQALARGIQFTTLSRLVPIDTCRQPEAARTFLCADAPAGDTVAEVLGN